MLLEDATSAEQVAAALEAGDDELREDIDDKLDDARREWERDNNGYDSYDVEAPDMRDIVERDDFVDHVIHKSPVSFNLAHVPRSHVEDNLRYAASHPRGMRETKYGPFYIDSRGGDYFSYKIEVEGSYRFRGSFLPENAEFIPSDIAEEFWASLGKRYTWADTSRLDPDDDNHAWGPGEDVYVEASEDDFDEWCRDTISEYVQTAVKREAEKAKQIFYAALADEDKALAEKLKAAELPDEEILDFTSKWFESIEDKTEVLEAIRDYFTAIEDTTTEQEVIAEYTRQDIANMGIKKGTLLEEAPWRLIKLRPSDLRLEGTLMGHCVGDRGMGYVTAVKDGEIEIWSLRSRNNKPRFTLEVDPKFYAAEENAAPRTPAAYLRAVAIEQLKGKANRTPGYADVRKTGGVKFPEEVVFWTRALEALDVDPGSVEDFDAYGYDKYGETPPAMQANDGEICVGFDLPYRPRSVRQNARRSSRRRGSKRRTSRRRSSAR